MGTLKNLYNRFLELFIPRLDVEGFEEKKYLFTKQSIEFRIKDDRLQGVLSRRYIRYIKEALIKKLEELGAKYIKDENNDVNVVIKLHSFAGCSGKNSEFSWDIYYSIPTITKSKIVICSIAKSGIIIRAKSSKNEFFRSGNIKIVKQFCKVVEKIVEKSKVVV